MISTSSSGSASPTIGRSPTPESEEEGSSLSQGKASSLVKGKVEIAPASDSEESDAESFIEIVSSDSEPEEKMHAEGSKIKSKSRKVFRKQFDALVRAQVQAKLKEMLQLA